MSKFVIFMSHPLSRDRPRVSSHEHIGYWPQVSHVPWGNQKQSHKILDFRACPANLDLRHVFQTPHAISECASWTLKQKKIKEINTSPDNWKCCLYFSWWRCFQECRLSSVRCSKRNEFDGCEFLAMYRAAHLQRFCANTGSSRLIRIYMDNPSSRTNRSPREITLLSLMC